MIRFIDLGKQIAVDETDPEWPRQFAFYDTVSDSFIDLGNGYVWDSWLDVLKYSHCDDAPLLDRLWNISPDWTKEGIAADAKENVEKLLDPATHEERVKKLLAEMGR
jgi:hypothetical protein